jgi:hypothetical protein
VSQSVVRVGADGLWGAFASERVRWRRITPATDMCPRYLTSVWAGYLLADLFKTYFQKPQRILSLVLHVYRGARSLAIANLVGRIRHALLFAVVHGMDDSVRVFWGLITSSGGRARCFLPRRGDPCGRMPRRTARIGGLPFARLVAKGGVCASARWCSILTA